MSVPGGFTLRELSMRALVTYPIEIGAPYERLPVFGHTASDQVQAWMLNGYFSGAPREGRDLVPAIEGLRDKVLPSAASRAKDEELHGWRGGKAVWRRRLAATIRATPTIAARAP
jgi:hypothetical protein